MRRRGRRAILVLGSVLQPRSGARRYAGASKSFQRGDAIATGLDSKMPLLNIQPGYAPEKKILGGQAYFGLGFGIGTNSTDADTSLALPTQALSRDVSDSVTGGTDLYPFTSLSWTSGNDNWMTYVTGDIPVGSYSSQGLSNIGIGHGAIDAGGGDTYLKTKRT